MHCEKSKALGDHVWCFSPRNALHKEKIRWMLNVFFLGSCIVGRMSSNHLIFSTIICVLWKNLVLNDHLVLLFYFVSWKKHWMTTRYFLMSTRIIPCRENVKWPLIYILLGLCLLRKTSKDHLMFFSWDASLWEECWASTSHFLGFVFSKRNIEQFSNNVFPSLILNVIYPLLKVDQFIF